MLRFLSLWLFSLGLGVGIICGQIIPGEPPAFPSTDDPRDQFVFVTDENGNPVSLMFTCLVTGSGPPVVEWYRKVNGVFVVDSEFKAENGSYLFPNITEADMAYASGDGVEYYCTATNDFGTIRSRTVKAFYADFKGFAKDGVPVPEGMIEPEERSVEVIVATLGNLQFVGLQCELVPGSTPTPAIRWIRRTVGAETGDALEENFVTNSIRFVDDGEWLILDTDSDAVTGVEYYCEVTNAERFRTVRGPLTYSLTPVVGFSLSDEPDGIKVYKPLTSRTVPRVAFDADVPASSPLRVVFGTAIAHNFTTTLLFSWRVNDRTGGRVSPGDTVASILPSFTAEDTDSVLNVELTVSPDPDEELEATLTLLDPAVIVDPKPGNVDDHLSGNTIEFTCNTEGSTPEITFYHNGAKLEDGDGVVIAGGTLTITPTSTGNSGMYQCIAENDSGSDGTSWFLVVRDPVAPSITTSFAVASDPCLGFPFIQAESAPVVLSVDVTTDPCPTADWTHNGGPLPDSGATINNPCGAFSLGDKFAIFTLTLDDITNDGTVVNSYGVTFSNIAGDDSVPETRVTGRVRADITGIRTVPDSPIEGIDTGCLSAGKDVDIVCDNLAFPVATVLFFKDGTEIVVEADERLSQNCDTLTITGVAEDDEATYSCRVQNDADQFEDLSENLKLEYCIEPSIVEGLTFTKKNPEEGEETIASCSWTGSPDPEVTWFKDDSPLVETDLPSRMRITAGREGDTLSSSLEIDAVELSDTGQYTCNISNPVKHISRVNRLEVEAPARPEPGLLSDDGVKIAVGLAVGLGFFGVCILLSVLAVLFFMWRVNVLKAEQGVSGGEYIEMNPVDEHREERVDMVENSAYQSRSRRPASGDDDDDNTYDTIT